MVGTGRGVGKYKGGAESTQMGVGGSFLWDGGWKEKAGMLLGGVGRSEIRSVVAMTEFGIPKMGSEAEGGRESAGLARGGDSGTVYLVS